MTSDTELVSLAIKMIKKYFTHGIVAGTASGAAFGVFVLFVVSPQIAAIESAHASGFHSTAESTLAFSTLFTIGGSTVWGLILELTFSLLYYIFGKFVARVSQVESVSVGWGWFRNRLGSAVALTTPVS